uniref:KTSC and Metallopeptidase-like N-terminal fusion domain-containing protein n=1 Tax=Pseudomonas phage HRDY3 TaxID=3236930 RepID=A0AB39CDJ3_9VIRU
MANYRYMGDRDLTYGKANDEYDLLMVQGDRFTMYRHGQVYIVQHEDAPDIIFKLTLKEGNALHNMSEELWSVEPDPDNPPYMLFKPAFESVPLLYDYYNNAYFNNECPPVKFVKSRNPNIWGLAELKFVNKKPVYFMHVHESAMVDRVLFTNTIIHEQIHLKAMYKAMKLRTVDPAKAAELLHDDHGPLFEAEMRRLNSYGFHIIKAATHEEFQRKATEEFYAIVALEHQHGKAISWNAWYTDKPLDEQDTDRLAGQLKDMFPHAEYTIKLIKTKDRNVTHAVHLKTTKTFTDASLKKKFGGDVDLKDAEVLYTTYLRPSIHVELPDFKEIPQLYCLPLDQFYKSMRSYTDDRMVLKAKWAKFPIKLMTVQTEEKFKILIGRMRRGGISDADTVNILNDFRSSYDQRYKHEQYHDAMMAMIKKYDGNGLLAEYAKIMRLIA